MTLKSQSSDWLLYFCKAGVFINNLILRTTVRFSCFNDNHLLNCIKIIKNSTYGNSK